MRLPLNEKDLPDYWYNIIPDLDFAIPQLMSPSGYPLSENDLEPIATHEIIEQEMEVSLYNALGRPLHVTSISAGQPVFDLTTWVSQLPGGMYIIRVSTREGKQKSMTLIKS